MNLTQALYQRGHKLITQGSLNDIFIPQSELQEIQQSFANILYNLMKRVTFRRKLRDWTFGKEPTEIIVSYLKLCKEFHKENKDFDRDQNKYSRTFEWFIGELLRREFGGRAAGFNIHLEDANKDDEFDSVALLDEGLFYAECKTGKGTLAQAVKKFVRRDKQLCAKYSLFIFDREYLFKRGAEDFPDFTHSQALKYGINFMERISKGSKYNFTSVNCGDRYFLVCNAFNKLDNNLRHMIRYVNMVIDQSGAEQEYKPKRIRFKEENSA